MPSSSALAIAVAFLSVVGPFARAESTSISGSNLVERSIHLEGRFDLSDKAGPSAGWSAATVALLFEGTDLNARIKDAGSNRWQIEIDGRPAEALQLKAGEGIYPIAQGLREGKHLIRLVKATEAMFGPTQFIAFEMPNGGRLLDFPEPSRRIEVIGDSISCGYGNEAPNQNEHFTPRTENAYYTYGAIAARTLGAGYSCIAWSGRKMWPDFTLPEIYDLTTGAEGGKTWDFSKQIPDAVVINLSTNDFGKQNPEEEAWTAAYKQFIARVRSHYPKALIYCASSPMMGDWEARKARTVADAYLHKIVADLNQAGDARVRFLEFAQQQMKDGLGADWHPNVKTQQIMAEKLVETLRVDLKW